MKRSRDDMFMSSPVQQPAISPRAEPSMRAQVSTASSIETLTANDALTYLKTVKENFQDKREKYDEFIEVMKDFKAQKIDPNGVILRVKELFEGNQDLILGFNTFLPRGYQITLPKEEDEPFPKRKTAQFNEAMSFVSKIKTTFKGQDHVYKAFLDILNMYKRQAKSIIEVYSEVADLFKGHADLLVEFTHFLPDSSGAASVQSAEPDRSHYLYGDDGDSPTIVRHAHIEKKPAVSYAVRDQYVNNPDSERCIHVEKEKEKREIKAEWEQDDNLDHRRKCARRDDSLHDQLHQGLQDRGIALCEKVKLRLQDTENYKKFYKCLLSYESQSVTAPQFLMLVSSLLGEHPDLMEECDDFITFIDKIGCYRNNKQICRPSVLDQGGDNHEMEDRYKNKDCDGRERYRYDRGLPFNARDVLRHKMSSYGSKEKFMMKPIQELDLSNCESCTPSYRLLPENYPIPLASHRTEIGAEVLNDRWVSVTSGSEDYSFKHMRKNQYEESLFRCEDDRFELDMLLESVNSTTKRVEELLDTMNAHTNKVDSSICIEDHLTALNLRCIERLYGDHGLDVMDVLRKNAPLALPVIFTRLKQKQEEWARCYADFNKVWSEIYSKNYHKSLDHRSFYFKQQDTKNLSAKALLAEIKELSEKNQDGYEMIQTVSAGYTQPIRPHMEFGYADPEIQEDLYQLMKYSSAELCTPEHHEKVMKIWSAFVETILDVPSRPPREEGKKDDTKAVNQTAKSLDEIGEENGCPADEAASENCEPSDMSKIGDENMPALKSCSDRVGMTQVNEGVNNDDSPGAESVAIKSDLLCNAPLSGLMQTDSNIVSSKSGGSDTANVDFMMEAVPSHESQDVVIPKLASSQILMDPKEVKTQKCHEDTEAHTKSGREEGELSPSRNPEGSNFTLPENTCNEVTKILTGSAPSPQETGGEEMRVQEAGEPAAHVDDEGGESAGSLSDSENPSDNGDASVTDSGNGDPDEDGPHDENGNKALSEEEADEMTDVHETEGIMPFSDLSQHTVKPLSIKLPTTLHDKERNSRIFYGNDSFYLVFRLHQMLYERMSTAKLHSSSPENKWRISKNANPMDSYARFKDALLSLLNGSSDNAKFEDECRSIIGAQSYILFTLDKLIHKLVKQLQTIATEEIDNKLLQLYAYERSRNPETFADVVYHENARFLILEDNLYRIECFSCPTRLTIQLMKNEHDKPEPTAVYMDPNFAAYMDEELLAILTVRKGRPRVVMKRNKRKFPTENEISDFCEAMEGLIIHNGVEMKVNCRTYKAAYCLGTEDFLYRPKKRRMALYNKASGNGAPNGASNGCSKRNDRCRLMFS